VERWAAGQRAQGRSFLERGLRDTAKHQGGGGEDGSFPEGVLRIIDERQGGAMGREREDGSFSGKGG